MTRYRGDPDTLSPRQRQDAAVLADIAATGVVPRMRGKVGQSSTARRALAEQLFLTPTDLAPLLVLLVAVTGRNVETIKELPGQHRILEGRAVEVRVLKRRHGVRRWWETVTWEIGRPDRELHTPGGLYLLLHRLTASSRQFSGSDSLWSIWRNGHRAGVMGVDEHFDPFAKDLSYLLRTNQWVHRHDLTTDGPTAGANGAADTGPGKQAPSPLRVDFNRLKTSIDVRRTKQMGGHLPSAARSNTTPVLFRNYLRNDPTTIEWAEDVMDQALLDAEQSALAAHERALSRMGGRLQIHTGEVSADELQRSGLESRAPAKLRTVTWIPHGRPASTTTSTRSPASRVESRFSTAFIAAIA